MASLPTLVTRASIDVQHIASIQFSAKTRAIHVAANGGPLIVDIPCRVGQQGQRVIGRAQADLDRGAAATTPAVEHAIGENDSVVAAAAADENSLIGGRGARHERAAAGIGHDQAVAIRAAGPADNKAGEVAENAALDQ